MRRLWLLGLSGIILACTGLTCPREPDDRERIAALRGFGSAEELRTYLVDQARAVNSNRAGGSVGPFFNFFAPLAVMDEANVSAPSESAGSGDAAGGDPFSTTNIQEAGVDESDIVKNDGQYIYVLNGNTIHIVQAAPPESVVEVSTIDIDAYGDSLYLRGTQLIALSRQANYYPYDLPTFAAEPAVADAAAGPGVPAGTTLIGGAWSDGVQTTVTVIDVSDAALPAVQATLRFEGDLVSSRLIDNRLYLVLTTTPRLPAEPTPAALAAMALEDWIPDYEIIAADGSVQSGDIAGWENFYRPADPDGYGIATVVTVDLDAPTAPFQATAISANAGTIYASLDALYVTDTSYDYQFGVSRSDTAIHKLAFDPEGTVYRGSGLVPGRLLNQYSLGEHDGYLRVATTVEEFGPDGSRQDNNVYVLGESADASLAIVGRIEGIAPGEQIYSARFIGDRGFLVTFRRIDPLFTLDLSDPARPLVAGELKVPGYSDHIQLLDENHLLTIGKDAQDAGTFAWVQGIQLSIFDVTDPANPALLHKEVIGGRGSNSEANHNPKAFNYFAAANALAFPADVYVPAGGGSSWGQQEFTGLYVYHVAAADGFQLLGRIASSEGTTMNGCFRGYYGFTRGVFIGDTVYSVTGRSVKASPLSAVGTILGEAALSEAEPLIEDCSGVPEIILPAGVGLR